MDQGLRIRISGKVIRGAGYGKKLGFPTANLDRRGFARLKSKPRLGVWAGAAWLGLKRYKAGIVIGPLDAKGLPKIEAYLLDWQGNLYRRKITLYLLKYLRPFRKYPSAQALKQAIAQDVTKIKRLNLKEWIN